MAINRNISAPTQVRPQTSVSPVVKITRVNNVPQATSPSLNTNFQTVIERQRPTQRGGSRTESRNALRAGRARTRRQTNTVPNRSKTTRAKNAPSVQVGSEQTIRESVPTAPASSSSFWSYFSNPFSSAANQVSRVYSALANYLGGEAASNTSVAEIPDTGISNLNVTSNSNVVINQTTNVTNSANPSSSMNLTVDNNTPHSSSNNNQFANQPAGENSSGTPNEHVVITRLHASSVSAAAREIATDPNLSTLTHLRFSDQACQQRVLASIFETTESSGAEQNQRSEQTSLLNQQIQWSRQSTALNATSALLNPAQLATAIGHTVVDGENCIQTLSVETAYLPATAGRIYREVHIQQSQNQAGGGAASSDSEVCVQWGIDEVTGLAKTECRPSARIEIPAPEVVNSPEGQAANAACVERIALVSDGISLGAAAGNIASSVFSNGTRTEIGSENISLLHTVNGIVPHFANNTEPNTAADAFSVSAIRRCTNLQIDDYNVTDVISNPSVDGVSATILTSHMLLQALDHILNRPDLPSVVVIFENMEIRNYHPDTSTIEILIRALRERGVQVMAYASSQGSVLNRITGIRQADTIREVIGRFIYAPPPLLTTGEIITMGTIAGLSAILSALGCALYYKKQRCQQPTARSEPSVEEYPLTEILVTQPNRPNQRAQSASLRSLDPTSFLAEAGRVLRQRDRQPEGSNSERASLLNIPSVQDEEESDSLLNNQQQREAASLDPMSEFTAWYYNPASSNYADRFKQEEYRKRDVFDPYRPRSKSKSDGDKGSSKDKKSLKKND